MSIESALKKRSESRCELCSADDVGFVVYEVPPGERSGEEAAVLLCAVCSGQISAAEALEVDHWRCLGDSMWSSVPAVQVLSWRMLTRLSDESWAQDLLEMLYLEEEVLVWAKSSLIEVDDGDESACYDSNGVALANGDSVTLIKDLVVKGANFTAKRGTSVKNISLADNPEQVEGRVNGIRVVLVSAFLKKTN